MTEKSLFGNTRDQLISRSLGLPNSDFSVIFQLFSTFFNFSQYFKIFSLRQCKSQDLSFWTQNQGFPDQPLLLRGAIDHRCTSISNLKQLILIKSPRPFQSRKYGYSEKILPFLGSSRTKAVLYRLGIPYAGAGGEGWGWELKNSYFRPFFVKIRSFSTFGALNPPKCPNKPKKVQSV